MRLRQSTYRYFSLLFFLSGFAGIIYQSVWAQYARLILGHAAFAQTFVLVLFVGGLGAGAWFAGRLTSRLHRLILIYALTEAMIGVLALAFHPLFHWTKHLIFDVLYPVYPYWSEVIQYLILGLLTLPTALLLGATFPLVTAALQRRLPLEKGGAVAQTYFVNSLGASIGILAAGFVFIPQAGLPGAMLIAGLINLLIFLMTLPLVEPRKQVHCTKQEKKARTNTPRRGLYFFMLWAAFLTGTSSFMYEMAWIRMLSMVLGSSVHAFELMLSAFIFGLALGAWWIRNRIDAITRPVRTLIHIQLLMGLFAVASLVVYNETFGLMQVLMNMIDRDLAGYYLFNLSSHFIAMLVMLPATICAGMSLPLMILILQKNGHGEAVIGKVYGLDTVGGILGVLIAVHLLMPLLGLKYLMIIAAAIDLLIAAGFWLIRPLAAVRKTAWLAAIALLVVVLTIGFVHPDPVRMASGVFRYGMIDGNNRILFHRDGKTASIAVYETLNGNIVLSTNGKPDASVNVFRQVSGDEATQVLLAALPLSMGYDAEQVAVIGLGSGKTAHTALMNFNIKNLDAIEIEPAVAEATKYFRPYVENIFTDRRFDLHLADARTFLAATLNTYDLIISEPSNPWVSGNASLFSAEFYRMVSNRLNEHGMFVQWLHTYEMNLPLISSVIRAFSPEFADYRLYYLDDGDLALIGRKSGRIPD
ncbi:MAG: fused MFS/spermidine synthase, partial [Bacteroidales bacterium]